MTNRNLSFRLSRAVIILTVMIGMPFKVTAGSATWNLNPTTDDWDTAANWTPETVPNELDDVATFDVSNTPTISSAAGFGISGIVFNPGASAYSIIANFRLSGIGIVNNSGITQNFDASDGVSFAGNATAGDGIVFTTNGNSTGIFNAFYDTSDAGSATLINEGAFPGSNGGVTFFEDHSSAANSTIINNSPRGGQDGGFTAFKNFASAGNSTITTYSGAFVEFEASSTGATATLIIDGGEIFFEASATGELARLEIMNGGILSIGHHSASLVAIGSLEGSGGTVQLGARQLSVGGNGRSTIFAGTITQNGSLTKTGSETLTLSGANSYSGGTTIEGGTLLVQTSRGSATGTGPVQVNAGTFGRRSNILGAVTIGSGSGSGAFLAPGIKGPGTLAIKKTLTFKADGTYNCELSLAQAKTDQVVAKGVTIESGAQFAFLTKGNQTLALGTVFTVINNKSPNPISGVFANLADGSIFTAKGNNFQASYEGGDGNDLTLTVIP